MEEIKEKIKQKIESLQYFYRHGYLLECKELKGKREVLDEKRVQFEEQIYFLEKILEELNSDNKPKTK